MNRAGKFCPFLLPTAKTRGISNHIASGVKTPKAAAIATTKWAFDNIEYQSDKQTYNTAEFFAGPDETLKRKAGDCEDFSMLIIAILRGMPTGLKPSIARMTIGSAHNVLPGWVAGIVGGYHAWAEVKTGGMWLICEGTGGKVFYPNHRYEPMFAIFVSKIEIYRGPLEAYI